MTPTFRAFNTQHLITLAIIAAICLLLAWKARSKSCRKWLGPVLGSALSGYAAVFCIQQGIEHALSWEYSLPLELCNLVLIACIISLFRPNQFTTEIAYFWGLGGVLQATLTPDLARGFPSWDFVFFFWSHGVTLMAIVFLIARPGFRPRGGSILRMMIALNIYAVIVGTLDGIAGWNYGYLCRKPAEPSLLDVLGKWPWYLVTLEVIALIMFLLFYLPWRIPGRSGKLEKAIGTADHTGEGGECL
jgi:hypothetical integral membrane protein (TIGR02206 family)